MYKPVTFFVGLRYMHRHITDQFSYFISWLPTIGITLGVMSLIIVLSIMNGFERELINNVLKLIPHVIISSSVKNSLDPQKFPKNLIKIQGINRIAPLTTSDVIIQSARGIAIGVMIGIDPKREDLLAPYLIRIDQIDLNPEKYNIILGKELAKKLEIDYGDQLRIIAPSAGQIYTPVGCLPSQRLFNVVGTFTTNSEVDSYQILVNIQDASRLMRYPLGYITGWRLWLNEPLKIDKLNQISIPNGAKWKDWRDCKGDLFQAVHMEKNMMELLLSLIIAVAAFNIIISLGLMVMEKRNEVAILQTQGMTPYQIMIIFMIQGVGAGIVGSLSGTLIGITIISQLNKIILIIKTFLDNSIMLLPVEINSLQVIDISLTAIFISWISTLYPSWKAASIQPASVLRYE